MQTDTSGLELAINGVSTPILRKSLDFSDHVVDRLGNKDENGEGLSTLEVDRFSYRRAGIALADAGCPEKAPERCGGTG